VPSRKEIQWSQLKVGALVMIATAVLIGLIFLMSGSSGGLFARKLTLRCYFPDASGLKNGAPVALQDVTIGNVRHIRLVPERSPNMVEVTMQVGSQYVGALHTDSKTSIAQSGVLGDSYVDIDSSQASGPHPGQNAELPAGGAPSIQDVIKTSNEAILQVQVLASHIDGLVTALNSSHGTIGELINNPDLFKKITSIATNIQTVTDAMTKGEGTLGKLLTDDSLYNRANSIVSRLDTITQALQDGKGSAGKLLSDDSFYKNLNSAAASASQIAAEVNAGEGTLGKLAKDPAFAQKLDDTISQLDAISKSVNAGQGTLGQLVKNRALYDHLDETLEETHQLVKGVREDPKKYLVIHLKLF
jgi:phospholipid/cholesterol/gamma-HCH transport system substrate-binding protein